MWVEEHGPIFKIELPSTTAVILTQPEDVAQVLKVDRYEKFTLAYSSMEKLTGEQHANMLTEDMGPYYKAIRRAVTPAFSSANLRQFYPALVGMVDRLMAHMAAHGEVVPLDMDRAAQRLTIDVIGHFAFDRDFKALTFGRNEALEAVSNLMAALQKMQNPLNRWFWWRKEARKLWTDRLRYDRLVRGALEDLRERPPAPHCLLAHLMGLIDPDTGKPLSLKRLRCETALFWIAGFETTAHAIGWTLMFIASHPQVEAQLASELDAAGLLATPSRPEPRPLAWNDLASLRFLNAVINESLRLMPPAGGGTVRKTPRDTQLGGQQIPAGTMVWIPFYALQRSLRVWGPDGCEFRPERWMTRGSGGDAPSPAADAEVDEVVKAAATQTARGFVPFSEGPRNCVGQALAMMELRMALAMMCGKFRFRLADEMGGAEGAIAAARQQITLKPGDKGLLMHAIPRVP